MSKKTSTVTVFYAWQSDSPDQTNRSAIRKALERASSRLEKMSGGKMVKIKLDEATRGQAGSPNIPLTILKKIEGSDILVCDVTTIVKQSMPSIASPNPNVIFELGFGVAHLGWERVVMLFNRALGEFPQDLPFDVDRHRASAYDFPVNAVANNATSARAGLESLLYEALRAIVVVNPRRPAELKDLSEKEIHRNRDVKALTALLSTIHWPTFDEHLQNLPHHIDGKIFFFWDGFNNILSNSLFHLHDASIRGKILRFYKLWRETFSYSEFYSPSPKKGIYIFDTPMDMFPSPQHEQAWKQLSKTTRPLWRAKEALLGEIRQNYAELDLIKLSGVAGREYVAHTKENSSGTARKGAQRKKAPTSTKGG